MLLHNQMLRDADDSLIHSADLDNFVNNASLVDVDLRSVNDIPNVKESFMKQLEPVIDKGNYSKSIQMSKEVRLIN